MKKVLTAVATAIIGLSAANVAMADKVGGGTVHFNGKVNDVSCTVSIDGQGSDATVHLAPLSLDEVKAAQADKMIKPKSFIIDVTNCSAASTDVSKDNLKNLNVYWTGGNLLSGSEKTGYLANTESTGAKNIHFVLSNDKENEFIVPGGVQKKNTGKMDIVDNGVRFEYKVGYVTQDPKAVTAGEVKSYATYEITYQ